AITYPVDCAIYVAVKRCLELELPCDRHMHEPSKGWFEGPFKSPQQSLGVTGNLARLRILAVWNPRRGWGRQSEQCVLPGRAERKQWYERRGRLVSVGQWVQAEEFL